MQRGQQPSLHNRAAVNFHVAKCEPHAQRRMDVNYRRLGLEVFVRLKNLHQHGCFWIKRRSRVYVAAVKTQFLTLAAMLAPGEFSGAISATALKGTLRLLRFCSIF
jgi:hypothetical protein